MANEFAVNQSDLVQIADAIRSKGETSDALVFPAGFVEAIQKISTGAELNYSVQAYASEELLPGTAEDNTIAVITDVDITGHTFSAEEPQTPTEGMLWIKTGTESEFEFAATNENPIHVYPVSTSQYNGGSWVDTTTLIYQNGTWKQWSVAVYLFKQGEGFFDYTLTGTVNAEAGWNVTNDRILFSNISDVGGAGYFSPILTGYKKLYFDVQYKSRASSSEWIYAGLSNNTSLDLVVDAGGTGWTVKKSIPYSTTRQTVEIDIEGKSGYVKFHALGVAGTIYNVWVE